MKGIPSQNMAGDANRSKRYANITTEIHNSSSLNLRLARRLRRQAKHEGIRAVQMKEWRTREVAFPMCLPAILRILDPANLFCNMQCTTVCITAAGSRITKRTPGKCPGGLPQRVARQDCRSITEGCFPAI